MQYGHLLICVKPAEGEQHRDVERKRQQQLQEAGDAQSHDGKQSLGGVFAGRRILQVADKSPTHRDDQ